MNVKRHCDLCENQILNLKEGTVCRLTGSKPGFIKTCLKINFETKLKSKLEELHIDLEFEKKNRSQIKSKIVFNSILGLLIMIGGYFFSQQVFHTRTAYVAYKVLPIMMMIIASGFYFFKTPFIELAFYNKEIKNLKEELLKIQEVLYLYTISYKTDIEILKEVHGTQEYNFDIEIINN